MPPRLANRLGKIAPRQVAMQRRAFLGLQQTPPPKPRMVGYLVMQGLAVVLVADFGFATINNHPTVLRSIAQSAGIWKEGPTFEESHKSGAED
ncbi:hypothetical protein Q7P37_007732 [Cladosporium fusiforme]